MPRKVLSKKTAVSNGYGHDLDELYASLNEMLEETRAGRSSASAAGL